ncbi:BAI1-associated protein 3-like [Liolophura sinensis]|uniref:BAI1-associated protein 3-like n=1 Tax=Liolophura sinensis TaxID=3198878 RepID=UPI0031597FC5
MAERNLRAGRRERSVSPSPHGRRDRRGKRQSRTLVIKTHTLDSLDYVALPYDLRNIGVQESDGNFFESFTALSWKQENRRLRTATEDEKEASKPPPSELQFSPKPKSHILDKKEFELLYIEVLYTIKHKIGTTTGGHLPYIQDLYQYAQEAFGVNPEDHARLLAKATEEKPPILIINICVVEARGLEAKDADGFSDPYCMLGIMPGKVPEDAMNAISSDEDSAKSKEKEKKGPLKKFSQSLKKKKDKTHAVRDMLPAKLIKTTSVKNNTLNPVWNEKFRFDLDDVYTDRLHLDIWDHDDESSVFDAAKKLNEVASFRGLGRFFKQVAQSARTRSSGSVDDFLGCVNVPLHDVPSTGMLKWYPLEGRTSRSKIQGEICLQLSLATREDRGIPEDDNWTDVKQHEDLMCIFIQHEQRKFRDASYKWSGNLPQAALTILHQHAIQGDVTNIQQAVCRWVAYSRKHMEHPFDYAFLLKLLEELEEIWVPGSLSRDEEESLAESFNIFIEFCLNLIRKIRDIFPPANKAAYRRLEYIVQCLSKIYKLKVFKRCCPFQKELYAEINYAVKKGTLEWYERMHAISKAQARTDEDVIQSLIELTNIVNNDVYKAEHYYNKIFNSIEHVHYFNLTYRQLEKLLADDASRAMEEELGDEMHKSLEGSLDLEETEFISSSALHFNTNLFELYLALQEFCRFKESLPQNEWRSLTITQYYEWFRFAVQKWLAVAKHKSLKRIKKAVELDKVAGSNDSVKYSTSAVDVCSCFNQIAEFWKQLSWPAANGAFTYVSKVTEDICNGAMLYADLVHEKLRDAGYYDEEGQFDVTEQLCITINNIEQVRRALKPLPETLGYSDIQKNMEKSHGEKGLRQVKTALHNMLRKADDEMTRRIKNVVDRVADKMRPDIKKDVFHLNWAPESVPAEDAVVDLMEYLDSNLLTLNNNLLRSNFDRILESIWVEVLEEFKDVMIKEEQKAPAFYLRMYEALGLLVDFFHANEKGLPVQTIKCPQYRELREQLGLRRMETRDLIEKFYMEKLQAQKELEKTDFGVLTVRVSYKFDSHTLLVEVVHARDIIPLDANGLSDPFVLIQLCPEHIFPGVQIQQTKVIKKTLNPDFDERFEFSIHPDQCAFHGSCIVFTVMDHDIMFQNDFAGEAFLSLREIPGVDGEEVTGYDALHEIQLPLAQPKHKENGAFEILLARTFDKEAQDFAKKRAKVEEQAV